MEQQIKLSAGCPGIVLYGCRRTGKSTILRNLTGFLPTELIPVNASRHCSLRLKVRGE